MTKRKVDVSFPVDEGMAPPTWRNGGDAFCDWTLCFGMEQEYRVHRIMLARGSRGSAFLSAAFTADAFHSARTARTDLSGLLPSQCAGTIFEVALDFVYTGTLPAELGPAEFVWLSKIGDALQMPALQNVCLEHLNKDGMISKVSAPAILSALADVGGIGDALHSKLQQAAMTEIATNFQHYSEAEIDSWSAAVLEFVLAHPGLQVESEDEVFKLVQRNAPRLDMEQRARLWRHVRHGFLSAKTLAQAAKVEEIPRDIFVMLSMLQARGVTGCLGDADVLGPDGHLDCGMLKGWPVGEMLTPRKYLRLKCAYLYAVQERDLEDAEYMRTSFYGKRLCAQLTLLGCETQMFSLCRKMARGALSTFDMLIIGDLFDPDGIHQSCRDEVARVLQDGKGLVMLHDTSFRDLIKFDEEHSPFRTWPERPFSDFNLKDGASVERKGKEVVVRSSNGHVQILVADFGIAKETWRFRRCINFATSVVAHCSRQCRTKGS